MLAMQCYVYFPVSRPRETPEKLFELKSNGVTCLKGKRGGKGAVPHAVGGRGYCSAKIYRPYQKNLSIWKVLPPNNVVSSGLPSSSKVAITS
jgi:hypothetical protein